MPTGMFGWTFRLDAFASWAASPTVGLVKRPKEFAKKEDVDKILTKKCSFAISCLILIFGFTFAHEMSW